MGDCAGRDRGLRFVTSFFPAFLFDGVVFAVGTWLDTGISGDFSVSTRGCVSISWIIAFSGENNLLPNKHTNAIFSTEIVVTTVRGHNLWSYTIHSLRLCMDSSPRWVLDPYTSG